MKSPRRTIPDEVQGQVLVASRRRCCLCFFVDIVKTRRKGQLAHLSGDPSNISFDDLVFLCLEHHDEFDSRTRQTKGFTLEEVRHYRDELYRELQSGAPSQEGSADSARSAEDKAIQALEQCSYQIGSATISGKELFWQVADRLARHRDAFLFGQEVAHALGVESRSVPEQEILNDLVMLGLVDSEYYAPPPQSGPQSSVSRPESPHQYILSDLGKSVLAHRLVDGSFLGNVLDVEVERRPDLDFVQGRSSVRAMTLGISITARSRDVERCTTRVIALDLRNLHADNGAEWHQAVAFNPITMAWSSNDGGGGEQPIRKGTAKFCDLVVYEHHQANEPASRSAKLVCLQPNQRDLPANEIGFAQYRARCEISAAGDFEPLVALVYFKFDPGQDDDDWQLTFVEPELAVVDQRG